MESPFVIELENVSKHFRLYKNGRDVAREILSPTRKKLHRKFDALRNINLEVKKGETLGIVGKNGSGKSTLLKLISKVMVPDSGRIMVSGKVSALLELGAGFNPEFTGLQNIRFLASISDISSREIEEKLNSIIEFADVGEHIDQPLKTYSSGMKARLGFAFSVNVDPDILILDEVLSVGDELFRRKCYAKMEEMFSTGKTVIYVSHNLSSVAQYCNRAVLLHDGEILVDSKAGIVVNLYEKLISTKPEKTNEFLKELREFRLESTEYEESNSTDSDDPKERSLTPYFSEQLRTTSAVSYENLGVRISNPKIVTLTGEQVNVLVTRQRYKITYQALFTKKFSNVAFGAKIRTEKGLDLSGTTNIYQEQLCSGLVEGDEVNVEISFTCNLLPGTYFVNVGVAEKRDGNIEYLARMVDVLAFKVLAPTPNICTGLVGMNQTLRCTKEGEEILLIQSADSV